MKLLQESGVSSAFVGVLLIVLFATAAIAYYAFGNSNQSSTTSGSLQITTQSTPQMTTTPSATTAYQQAVGFSMQPTKSYSFEVNSSSYVYAFNVTIIPNVSVLEQAGIKDYFTLRYTPFSLVTTSGQTLTSVTQDWYPVFSGQSEANLTDGQITWVFVAFNSPQPVTPQELRYTLDHVKASTSSFPAPIWVSVLLRSNYCVPGYPPNESCTVILNKNQTNSLGEVNVYVGWAPTFGYGITPSASVSGALEYELHNAIGQTFDYYLPSDSLVNITVSASLDYLTCNHPGGCYVLAAVRSLELANSSISQGFRITAMPSCWNNLQGTVPCTFPLNFPQVTVGQEVDMTATLSFPNQQFGTLLQPYQGIQFVINIS